MTDDRLFDDGQPPRCPRHPDGNGPDWCMDCHPENYAHFFEPPLPRPDQQDIGKFHAPASGAPETEREAAIGQWPKAGTDRMRVLEFFVRRGDRGAIDEEVALGLKMRHYTAAPRRNELRDAGWLVDSGRRRPTTTGTPAAVWVLSEQGRHEWDGLT